MFLIFKAMTLTCVFELKKEVRLSIEIKLGLAVDLDSEDWLCQLCYMTDIFHKLNELNTKFI